MNLSQKSIYYEELIDPYWKDKKGFIIKAEHLMRYKFAKNFLKKKFKEKINIYDIGCGNGYGSKILASFATNVIGFDKSLYFLKEANNNNYYYYYKLSNQTFQQINFDITSLLSFVQENKILYPNAIICFETLEHLENPSTLIKDIYDLLPHKGYFIFSLPNAQYEPKKNGKSKNRFHKHLFYKSDVLKMLKNFSFSTISIFGQPYPNLLMHRLPKLIKFFDSLVMNSVISFEVFSRLIAYPTKHFNTHTYSYTFVCQKT